MPRGHQAVRRSGSATGKQRAHIAAGYGRHYVVGRQAAVVAAVESTISWWLNPATFYADAKVAAARMAGQTSRHTYARPLDEV